MKKMQIVRTTNEDNNDDVVDADFEDLNKTDK